MKEALLYERLEKNLVRCNLCSHRCGIAEGKFGFCGVRQNVAGTLCTHAFGRLVAAHIDPIEKKPLYHFLPGTISFSIATMGCNFRCGFCQNWQISQEVFNQRQVRGEEFSPQEIVKFALDHKCRSISYTYTEPTIFFEYALETAKIAREKGLDNVFVTNGYMTKECLELARSYLDAANVDLKFFKEDSYKSICQGSLQPVLDSIRLIHDMGIWIEITTLVVPKENDSEEELRAIARFIAGVDKNIPWHISRFHPDYKFIDRPATAEATIRKAQEIAKDCGLHYVYAGNVYGWGNDTHCHNCGKLLIKREGFSVLEYNIEVGKCINCKTTVPGIFKY